MKARWTLSTPRASEVQALVDHIGISPLTAQCLINRGQAIPAQAETFLDPRLKLLDDPFRLPDIDVAVERLFRARELGEGCVIFGDYDVDGVTATSLLEIGLKSLGWRVRHYLPHRRDDGYGLTRSGLDNCLSGSPTTLLIAVDCGSTSGELIQWLQDQGIDVLVLDHHQVSSPPPKAFALVNPQTHPPDETRGRELCSAGIAFKVLHALVKRGRERALPLFNEYDIKKTLDLVALGTIADLVPLIGENRILVHNGLKRLDNTTRPGLVELKAISKTRSPIGTFEVGFQLGPRLNAAGRLETAEAALELLLTEHGQTARSLAETLDLTNRERRDIEGKMVEESLELIRAKFNPMTDYVLVEGRAEWHTGVVGIVASRVSKEFHRPTFILGRDRDVWRGSGRSIPGFDLAAVMRECGDVLLRHGGHAMAAGISIDPNRLDEFRARINRLAMAQIAPELLLPEIRLDAEVHPSALSLAQVEEFARLEPFGQRNPPVQILMRDVTFSRSPERIGKQSQHWKFWLSNGGGGIEAVWWGAGRETPPQGAFDAAVEPKVETYGGRKSVTLRFLAWRPVALAARETHPHLNP